MEVIITFTWYQSLGLVLLTGLWGGMLGAIRGELKIIREILQERK